MFQVDIKHLAIGIVGVALAAGAYGVSGAAESAKAVDPSVTWAPAPNSIVNPSKNTSLDAWEAYKNRGIKPSVDEHLDDPILKGAIDIHAHFGPDSYDRQWDAFEIAKMAHERGMRGLVFKNHWSESAGLANLVRKYDNVPGLEVFGALVLNTPVGGINPQAVRYFAEVEGHYGKVVWMPTHDSEKEVESIKETRPYVIVSRDGVLLPSVLEVLDLIAQYKLTLATGHVSAKEMVQIVTEARKRGIEHIIITHPGLGPQYTDPSLDQLKQVTAMGAYAEAVSTELFTKARAETVKRIKAIGPARYIVSTDSGLVGSRNHPDALVRA
ncbi:MAG: DUF6282 family protein, partial [Rhodospirillaceae bacterium]